MLKGLPGADRSIESISGAANADPDPDITS